jgi:hypothetical protein
MDAVVGQCTEASVEEDEWAAGGVVDVRRSVICASLRIDGEIGNSRLGYKNWSREGGEGFGET